jgi:hypothetical protein
MQGAFAHEWLFCRDDPGHDEEATTRRARKLPLPAASLRPI